MLNKNEKGLSKLLETLQRYEEIRDSISVAVKEHGYQEYTNSDDDEIIMISKPGELNPVALVDMTKRTIAVNNHMENSDDFELLLEISNLLNEFDELLDEDIEDEDEPEAFATVKTPLVSDKVLENIASLPKDTVMSFSEFTEAVFQGLTSLEQRGVLATFDLSADLYPASIYEQTDANLVISSHEEKPFDDVKFNHMLGIWIEDSENQSEALKVHSKRLIHTPYTITVNEDGIACSYIDDNFDEDVILEMFEKIK